MPARLWTAWNALWDWVDDRFIIRRAGFAVMFWMTWEAYVWAAEFASTTERTGIETAAIIAAVTAPISALLGHAMTAYNAGRKT